MKEELYYELAEYMEELEEINRIAEEEMFEYLHDLEAALKGE